MEFVFKQEYFKNFATEPQPATEPNSKHIPNSGLCAADILKCAESVLSARQKRSWRNITHSHGIA